MSNVQMWSETFGDEYLVRNDGDFSPRGKFFHYLFKKYPVRNILEVGCNHGMNLDLIGLPAGDSWGCDVNRKALNLCHVRHKDINAVYCSGFDLPFRTYFDCVFTCGVLIHQRPEEIDAMMQEIIRVSNKYVLCMEYYAPEFQEIKYRGHEGALFKGPYGDIYEKRYMMRLLESGLLTKSDGFDDVTYWFFRKD